MKGVARRLVEFLEGSEKQFFIPVYQRNYEWGLTQCKQLFNDLEDVISKKRNNHFFGSIVSILSSDYGTEFQIIDGQQRLTTISLLLLSMHNLLKNNIVNSIDNQLQRKIFEEYLVNKYNPEEKRIKLKNTSNNQKYYESLLDGDAIEDTKTNILLNYNYFTDRIKNSKFNIDELFSAIKKLIVIDIVLNKEDEPQKIFESINSTGLDLSEADKIRNYLLMDLDHVTQESFYSKYWNKIEINLNINSILITSFIRDYLTLKTSKIGKQSEIYIVFKEYYEQIEAEKEAILISLLEYSNLYSNIINAYHSNDLIKYSLKRINQLEATVTYPFILQILKLNKDNYISNNDILRILNAIENYIFKRVIVELPSNALGGVFSTVHKEVDRYIENNYTLYADAFIYALKSRTGNARFPDIDEFEAKLRVKDIYSMQPKNKHYLFEKFENRDNLEHINVYEMIQNGTFTIEHIMPQTLTDEWINDLGSEYDRVYLTWLHRFANLSLTAYNSKYSNSSFRIKKTIDKGYNQSNLKLNQYLKEIDVWNEDMIQNREDILVKEARLIWPTEETSFIPKFEIENAHMLTLLDEFDYTVYEIKAYTFESENKLVKNWTAFFEIIIKKLFDMNATKFLQFASTDPKLNTLINNKNRKSFVLSEDINFVSHMPTNNKIEVLRLLFNYFEIDESELTMSVVHERKNQQPEKPVSLWTELKTDFINKLSILGITDLKYSTNDGYNLFTSKSNNLKVKVAYSRNYVAGQDSKYRVSGWNALPKNIVESDITHFIFAIQSNESNFEYFIFTKQQFLDVFYFKRINEEKNYNFYFAVTNDERGIEHRSDDLDVTKHLNSWNTFDNN